MCIHLRQRLIDLQRIQTTRPQPLQPLLFLHVSPGALHPTPCTGTDPLLQQLQLMVKCFLVWLVCSLAQTHPFPSRGYSHKYSERRKDLPSTHLDFCKEMSEAAFWVDLKRRSQVQYELHDDGLVGHLFHQRMFLGMKNIQHCCSVDHSNQPLSACLRPNLPAVLFQKASVEHPSRTGLPLRIIVEGIPLLRFKLQFPHLKRLLASEHRTGIHSIPITQSHLQSNYILSSKSTFLTVPLPHITSNVTSHFQCIT